MVLRYRNYESLLNAVTLGTSLTALFLLVRCSVPERDYADLNIGNNNAGSSGVGGSAGDGAGGAPPAQGGTGGGGGLGGVGGMSDVGGQGGQGGTPPVPVPCDSEESDAGTDAGADASALDAGSEDAEGADAGGLGDACECVDGFIRAVDADGDGERSRACSVAPGEDCDDGDSAVTHNSCGGCSELPNAVGEDCLECGAYICAGPDTLACGAKPGPVEDPDCRCVDGTITARDTDGDGAGTRLCETNPGSDCNDGDKGYITNECGGCAELAGSVGGACNQCGVYACSGTALTCVPSTGSAGQRCLNTTTRQTCVGTGFWGNDSGCAEACYQGNCETCLPGTFRCVPFNGSNLLQQCITDASLGSSSYGVGWGSYASCSLNQGCDAEAGQCTGQLLLPRDRSFDVLPRQRGTLPWHDLLNTASDSDYG